MPNTLNIKLSPSQTTALRNENINRNTFWVGALAGGLYFSYHFDSEKDDIISTALATIGIGATAHGVSSALFPVRAKDLLTFDTQTLQGLAQLGATTNKSGGTASAGGADPYTSAFNLLNTGISAFFGSETEREQTRQIEAQYQGQTNVINAQTNLQSEMNTGEVYKGVFDNLRAKSTISQGSQQTTRFLTGAGVLLVFGGLAYLAFAPTKKEEKQTKKPKKNEDE